jgi:hypothetical protein
MATPDMQLEPIVFTQFLRPNGTPHLVDFPVQDREIRAMADDILAKDLTFTCEELMNGMAVFYITDERKGVDVAIEMCPNGPDVPDTVHKMIRKYHARLNVKEDV